MSLYEREGRESGNRSTRLHSQSTAFQRENRRRIDPAVQRPARTAQPCSTPASPKVKYPERRRDLALAERAQVVGVAKRLSAERRYSRRARSGRRSIRANCRQKLRDRSEVARPPDQRPV